LVLHLLLLVLYSLSCEVVERKVQTIAHNNHWRAVVCE